MAVAFAGHDLIVLGLGALVAVGVGLAVMRVAHPSQLSELLRLVNRVLGRGAEPPVVNGTETA